MKHEIDTSQTDNNITNDEILTQPPNYLCRALMVLASWNDSEMTNNMIILRYMQNIFILREKSSSLK